MPIHGFPGGVISSTAVTPSPTSASGVWTLDEQFQNSANWPLAPTFLSNSVRIRASATAYMARTFPTAGNRKTWTWSGWIKRGTIGTAYERIFGGPANASHIYFVSDYLQFDLSDIGSGTAVGSIKSSAVYRDPASWYHIVAVCDTTQATSSNRMKLFVNGTQITALSEATYPSQNYESAINSAGQHTIGYRTATQGSAGIPYDGYLADINFIDGQALTPNYFGATDGATGVWEPANYKGTYGTNGFYLPMNIEVLQKSFTKSLRFRASNSAYLNRTPATTGSQTTFTFSAWIKRGTLSSGFPVLFMAGNTVNDTTFCLNFNPSDNLTVRGYTGAFVTTAAVYRDPAAWYHIVCAVDTTQATSTNRFQLYVNGVLAGNGTVTQNYAFLVNTAVNHTIGSQSVAWGFNFFDGYMAEVNFVDGLALTPNYFGQTDTTSGAWQPVAYTGQYGTNGYYLPFTNTASTAALGFDASGRNNNWTTNNFSLTAGATYDSMTDVPTLTSATESNYAVINPLENLFGSTITVSQGNLRATSTTTLASLATIALPTSGSYYFEYLCNGGDSNEVGLYGESTSVWRTYDKSGQKYSPAGYAAYGASWTTNDVIGVAVDMSSGKLWFAKNGTWQASGDPAAGTNAAFTDINTAFATEPAFFYAGAYNGTHTFNFGQRPFAYTPPTGFVALNAFNM